jgi:hypothetical protein
LITSGTGTAFAAGDTSTTATFTTAGAPTAITLTRLNSSTTDSGTAGALVTVGLKDAAGNATVLAANEALDFAATGTGVSVGKVGIADTVGVQAGTALAATDFWNAGTAVLRVYAASAIAANATSVLSVTGSGLLPATLTSNTTISVLKSTAPAAGQVISMTDATGFEANTAPSYWTNKSSAGYTFTVGTAVSATTVYGVNIVDQDNQRIPAATGDLTWNIPVTLSGTTAATVTTGTFSVSATLAAGKVLTIAGGTTVATLTGKDAAIKAVAATLANVVAAPGAFFIGDGGLLSNISGTGVYGNANVAAYLPTYTGNLDNVDTLTANVISSNATIIANSDTLGTQATPVSVSQWVQVTTASATPIILMTISATDVTHIDFNTVATDTANSSRQVSKLMAISYNGVVNYNEYGSLLIGSIVGDFTVTTDGTDIFLNVIPTTSNSIDYNVVSVIYY